MKFKTMPKGPIKAVIFDCDGTLVDSEYAHFQAWKHACGKKGRVFREEEYHHYVGKPFDGALEKLAEELGHECAEEILNDKEAYFQQLLQAGHPPIQPTIDFLHLLAHEKKKRGMKLGLASAADKREILINLKNHKIEHFFDVIISGEDDLNHYNDPEGVNKPKPYIYLHAAKSLGLATSECAAIEDSHTGVTASLHAGCFTVAVPNQFTKHHDLSHAHLKLESFANISVDEFLQMTSRKSK